MQPDQTTISDGVGAAGLSQALGDASADKRLDVLRQVAASLGSMKRTAS